jgi:hypothetical protein
VSDDHRLRNTTTQDRTGQGACLNCGNPLSGPFCPACGQRNIPPYPSTRELAQEAISEFSGWDGRLGTTLRALIRKPGLLTVEFLQGRRVRYISPLRLYLSASLVYFLLAAGSPDINLGSGRPVGGLQISTTTTTDSAPTYGESSTAKPREDIQITPEERATALADAEHAPLFMRALMVRAINDPAALKRGILENMPRVVFALLPVCAGIIALFYRRRKYPEHLYFAIHLYAFVFIALAVSELSKFTHVAILAATVNVLVLVAIPVYASMALRRVYGGSWGSTIRRAVGIGLIYGVVAGAAFVAMVFLVAVGGA